MPEQPDDHVPPMKVMRKRLNGVYRADSGFSGPTRRYVLIVALLVGLASVPTLAAITAGTNELADTNTDTMDIPFLPPASPGPIQTDAPDDPDAGSVAAQGGAQGADAALRAGRLLGSAGPRKPKAGPGSRYGEKPSKSTRSRAGAAGFRPLPGMPRVPALPSVPGESATVPEAPSRPVRPARPARPVRPAKPVEPARPVEPAKPVRPADPARPANPGAPAQPGKPAEPARPEEPDGRAAPALPHVPELPVVPDDPVDRDVHFPDDDGNFSEQPADSGNSDNPADRPNEPEEPPARAGHPPCPERGERHPTRSHARPDDRARHSRRSAVAERPHNIRPSRILERSYASNSSSSHGRRLVPEARSEENHRAYRGSHRAGSLHHADEHTPAQQRSSRVGRHHAESTEDVSNRW